MIRISGLIVLLVVIQLTSGCDSGRRDDYNPGQGETIENVMPGDTLAENGHWIFDGTNPWLSRVKYFGRSFALVNLLIIVIVISIVTMVSLLIFILLNRRRMEWKEKLYQYLLEAYQGLLIEYLYGESDIEKFNEIASSRYRRQVLIDQIKDVSVNLKGDSWAKLRELYLKLGLGAESLRKAYDRRWHIKIKGFRELAYMNMKDANEEIFKCLNSGNEILRMEAQIALVRLNDDNPFGFLDHLIRPFSLWEQITLHELIVQHGIDVPEFRQWLNSPNDTVVMFALRMIKEFNQISAEGEVRKILNHNSGGVRRIAIEVAGDLKLESTLEVMKRMYKNEDYCNPLP